MDFEKELSVVETGIEGLKVLDLSVHGDSRGWFKENYQRAKMVALGIPDLHVVQNNVSFNANKGVTRGIHAEPWDKFISIAAGSVFGAWGDLREGSETFGKVFTCTLDCIETVCNFTDNTLTNARPIKVSKILNKSVNDFTD